jgi:tRNA (guanine37-N1)-methyltransferase
MRIDILTLFPAMFDSVLSSSILKRAGDAELHRDRPGGAPVSYHVTDIRALSTDKHSKVDKPPYGGGPGMVIQCQPVWDAVMAAQAQDPAPATRVLMTPQGRSLTQTLVEELAAKPRLLIIAGHYEGIDERVIQKLNPLEISIGDYVLSGGELPAMVLIDAVVRLLPGALGDESSTHHESFSRELDGGLDYPVYTRPPVWQDLAVPEILLSGDHARIEAWRREQAKLRTAQRRPDLLKP